MLEIKPIPISYPVTKTGKIKKDNHPANQQTPKQPKQAQELRQDPLHVDETV